MASNSNSEEYEVVKKRFGSIVSRTQPVLPVLANELFSRDLVSNIEHSNAMNSNQPVYLRASVMIMSILTKIKNDISWYSKFVSALMDSDLGSVATDLESSLNSEKSRSSTLPITGECMVMQIWVSTCPVFHPV